MRAAQICLCLLLSCGLVIASSARLLDSETTDDSIIEAEFDSIDELFSYLSANWPPFNQIIDRETNHYFCLNEGRASLAKSQIKNLFEDACDLEASGQPITLSQAVLQMSNTNALIDMEAFSIYSLLRVISVLKKNENTNTDLRIFERNLIKKALNLEFMSSKRLSYACSCLLSANRYSVIYKLYRFYPDDSGAVRRLEDKEFFAFFANMTTFYIFSACLNLTGIHGLIGSYFWILMIYSLSMIAYLYCASWYYSIF